MTKYYIGSGSDDCWRATNAKTLNGAKAAASKTYKQAAGLKIEVAIAYDFGAVVGTRYYPVAVKYAYGKWQAGVQYTADDRRAAVDVKYTYSKWQAV